MAIGTKVCKVCGKEYEACRTLRPNLDNEFRWNEVACCPEHGAEYLRRVLAARGQAATAGNVGNTADGPAEQPKKTARRRAQKKDEE